MKTPQLLYFLTSRSKINMSHCLSADVPINHSQEMVKHFVCVIVRFMGQFKVDSLRTLLIMSASSKKALLSTAVSTGDDGPNVCLK